MAFNPFRRFRKHQKVIMAGIILLSMITFIGISGAGSGGDFFSDITRLFTRRVSASAVASIYGREVSQDQLVRLRKQREIANVFMVQATQIAAERRVAAIRKSLGDSPQAQQALMNVIRSDADLGQLNQRIQFAQFGIPYFGGGFSTDGLIDFLIWKHQADRLGITLTTQDVSNEVARLTLGYFKAKDARPLGWPQDQPYDSATLERALRNQPEFRNFWSEDIVVNALTDELRVRMAQNALTGYEPGGIDRVAAPVTPAEFWNFYKDNCTSVEAALLPVRVEDFVSQVKQKPTEAELKALYDKYKDRDYDPESPEPGFKRPHRIQLEWVSASADSPFYKQLAADSFSLAETLRQVLAGGSMTGPVAAGANIALAKTVDDRLVRKYNELKWQHYRNASWSDYWLSPYPMHAESFAQPADVAALVGQSLGLAGTVAAPLSAVTSGEGLAARREIRDRVLFDTALVLFGGPRSLPLSSAALVAYGTPREEFVPLQDVKDEILEKVAADQAREVRNYVIEEVKKEIDKLAKKDRKAVAKYVAEAIKKYHLHAGKTTQLRDRYRNPVGDDPGLAPLKEAYLKPPSEDPTGKRFAEQFFPPHFGSQRAWETYSVKQWPDRFTAGTADKVFLFWKTEDQPAKVVPFSDPDVRQQVERDWRFQKARELAKKEADRLAAEVQKQKGDVRKIKDLAEAQKKPVIELMPLARLNRRPSTRGDAAYQYDEPRIAEDRVPYVQGRSDFAEKLVDLRRKEKGDTTVLADQPQGVYYVVALVNKLEPSFTEFCKIYENSATGTRMQDPLLRMFERDRQEKYRTEFMERLRRDAKFQLHKEAAARMNDQGGGE